MIKKSKRFRKKEMESHLSKSDLSKVRRGELPNWMKKYDKG